MDSNIKIAVIGLGYVGLPLARLFTKYAVVGYDINHARVAALQSGSDSTFEVDEVTLQNVRFTCTWVCIAPLMT
jgi:UDP-N-acetyl-D-galactosamine dehydrogenase